MSDIEQKVYAEEDLEMLEKANLNDRVPATITPQQEKMIVLAVEVQRRLNSYPGWEEVYLAIMERTYPR